MPRPTRYKFVELSTVTDESIETAANELAEQGWHLVAIHFAMREASHRPSMAFLQFVRDDGAAPTGEAP
jgi:hypothetical protein